MCVIAHCIDNPMYNANNQSACVKCPEHAFTLGPSSTSLADCLCDRGYHNDEAQGGVHCAACPVGTSCSGGATLATMQLKVGYYRQSNRTIDVRRCPDAGVNCAGLSRCVDLAPDCPLRPSCAGGHARSASFGRWGCLE